MYDPGGGPPNLVPQQPDNLNFGLARAEETNWFIIKNENGDNSVSNLKFREGMIIIPKLLKENNINVSDVKHINNNTSFLIQSEKKNRDKLINIHRLGNIKCSIIECINKNSTKGIVHHPSFTDSNNKELLEDLKQDNPNIINAHIFTKKVGGSNVNTSTAVITFDSTELPQKIKYLRYNSISVKQYYPKPTQCYNCWQFEHFSSAARPCTLQRVCGNCSQPHHLNNPSDKCEKEINCTNCQGPHQAWSRKCPEYLDQARYVQVMVDHRCSFKEAKNMIERKDPVKYNTVTAKDLKQPTKDENAELKNLSQQVAIMSTKLEVVCNLLHTIIKSQREQKTIQVPENMVIEDTETDDDEENEIIPATPNQPTYYTVDYTKRGNNNPPAQHNRNEKRNKRQASDKKKEKESKKKKDN